MVQFFASQCSSLSLTKSVIYIYFFVYIYIYIYIYIKRICVNGSNIVTIDCI